VTTPSTHDQPRLRSHYDVVIVGAGVAGCATAVSLARADRQQRRSILVVDLHREVSPRFSGEFIHPRGAQVLDDLGFYGPLSAAGAVDVDGFVAHSHADEPEPVVLDYATIPGERPRGLSVHHKTIVKVMRQTMAARPQVTLCAPWRVTDLTRAGGSPEGRIDGVLIRDPEGEMHEIHCDLVVAADGKASPIRKMAGIKAERQNLGFTAGLEVPRARVQHTLHANVFLGGPGPMLCYPIERRADGTLTSRLTFDLPQSLPAKGAAVSTYLLEAFVPYLPAGLADDVTAALANLDGPLEMAPTINLPAPQATGHGLVLVGDAAGCSHPITASGMTMGLLDAKYLGREAQRRSEQLADDDRSPWLDDRCLRRYRYEHDRYVPTRQALADSIFEAFRGVDTGARGIRRALFSYWRSGSRQRTRSLALLACAEQRPQIFLAEYLKTAGHVVQASMMPQHASHYPFADRLRQAHGAVGLAGTKVGMVAQVAWSQIRPSWLAA